MSARDTRKPRLGISSCLLGRKVRYDGQHKKDTYLTDTLGPLVEWVAVCPEVEAGMGVPRESVRLVGTPEAYRMVAERSQKDWTGAMERFAQARLRELEAADLDGFILKKDSPSCGMQKVRVYNASGMPQRAASGFFARALMRALPLLPVEEDGRLNDPKIRENFIERVFAYRRWRALSEQPPSRGALVAFHAAHKFLILAHSDPYLRRLGRLTAELKGRDLRGAYEEYGRIFMEALSRQATLRQHVNVLQHIAGFLSDHLDPGERQELASTILDYRKGLVPLIVPITLIRHHVAKHPADYLKGQVYLEPHPKELMIRNHV